MRNVEEIHEELGRLMREHIESMKTEIFVPLSQEELRLQEERLTRIRDVSAEYLATIKRIA
jgi:hypothetical protein